jgi:hypothetical protein
LDETIFSEQLSDWWNSAYSILATKSTKPLPNDLKYFPSLLFQVLAQALQFLPTEYDHSLEDLKLGAEQSFSELSEEYSECGVAIASLLGRHNPSLACVQQEFLRASWLKNSGRITEAWHTIGQAVR